eukprot:scaffold20987_cov31-Tisochrysis_lutea.AAC.4
MSMNSRRRSAFITLNKRSLIRPRPQRPPTAARMVRSAASRPETPVGGGERAEHTTGHSGLPSVQRALGEQGKHTQRSEIAQHGSGAVLREVRISGQPLLRAGHIHLTGNTHWIIEVNHLMGAARLGWRCRCAQAVLAHSRLTAGSATFRTGAGYWTSALSTREP